MSVFCVGPTVYLIIMVRRIIIAAFILFAYFIPYVFINSALLTSFSLEVRASNVIIIVQDSTHIFNNELHSFILETTTQRRSQPSHGQKQDFREM